MVIRKPLDLPPAVGRAFVDDMRAYFAESDSIKRDLIAVRQLQALKEFQGPREKKLRLSDVKEMFLEMKDSAQKQAEARAMVISVWFIRKDTSRPDPTMPARITKDIDEAIELIRAHKEGKHGTSYVMRVSCPGGTLSTSDQDRLIAAGAEIFP
jgi:hypothetical protein